MSEIFKIYAKIMADKDKDKSLKGKSDPDYNVVPEATGPDSPVEETGYELTEIAHPDQIQVAESQRNDGIVENDVEQQKEITDIARRNPRGFVVAELMSVLVKAANILDTDLTISSIEMVKQIDNVLEKLAQEVEQIGGVDNEPHEIEYAKRNVNGLYDGFGKIAAYLSELDFESTPRGKDLKEKVNNIAANLRGYSLIDRKYDKDPESLKSKTYNGIKYLSENRNNVFLAIRESNNWGAAAAQANIIWNYVSNLANNWLENNNFTGKNKSQTSTPATTTAPKTAPSAWTPNAKLTPEMWAAMSPEQQVAWFNENQPNQPQAAEGVAMKAAPKKPGYSWNTKLNKDKVEKLQELVGATVDGKFGPETLKKVLERASDSKGADNDLKEFLHGTPAYTQSFHNWNDAAVDHAILSMNKDDNLVSVNPGETLMPKDWTIV